MGILLSEEECFEMVGELHTTYEEDLALIAKTQLKKVMELLKQRAVFVEWEWKDSKGIWEIRFDDNEWQELLREVEPLIGEK